MNRIYNFSAGPSQLPLAVMEKVQKDLLSYGDSGQSVMEMSHRSSAYDAIFKQSKQNIKDLLAVGDDYEILFIQGGASMQFDMLAQNLKQNGIADYVVTGEFSGKAASAAKKITDAAVVATGEASNFTVLPALSDMKPRANSDYLHICSNNTIYGTRFTDLPDTGDVPLVADMSSCIMSEPIDVNSYGMIYAGAQKNMGPAGFALVIIRKDLLERSSDLLPLMSNYRTYAKSDSMHNTPPTFAIYVAGLVAEWIATDIGGLEKMAKRNEEKAAVLYDYIDKSSLYSNTVDKSCRSMMNVTFVTGDKELDAKFCKEAEKSGFANLKGHRLVGGMRASIYNAMPKEGIEKLTEFMREFENNV